jgi:eukaryotic-like serine/threonine-protein kinase
MPTPESTTKVWHFGIYEVDASRVELRRNGTPVKLREQSFLVLIQLLEHAGELVTREELRQLLWPSDTFVDFDHSLSTAVMKLRDALGDSTGTPVYIQTVPKHGYRFIAKVTAEGQNPSVAEQNSAAPMPAPEPVPAPVPAPVAAERRGGDRMWQGVAGLAAVLLVVAVAWIAFRPRSDPAPPAMVRFQIPAPDRTSTSFLNSIAISPDGQHIAFSATKDGERVSAIFVRPMNGLAATEIAAAGSYPFWSPDGQQIGFSVGGPGGPTLKRVDLSGGPPVTICTCQAFGGTWNRDGLILTSGTAVVVQVPASGGDPKPLWKRVAGEKGQSWPQFLPDGKHYLYLSISNGPPYQPGIYVNSIDSNDPRFLVASDTNAAYAQGQLLFTRGDVLMAQPFDPGTMKLSGEPHRVADHLERTPRDEGIAGLATFSASSNGLLAWRNDTRSPQVPLQWFDRSGKKLTTIGEVADYSHPSLSPDDSKLAVCIRDPQAKNRNIWIFDLLHGTRTRLTFDPADDIDPVWSPDGTRIAFTSDRSGQRNIYWKPADGSRPEELLLGGKDFPDQENVEDWSRDGKYLIFNNGRPLIHDFVLPLANRKPVPVDSEQANVQGQISPNGRWIAFSSEMNEGSAVYVEGFSLDSSQPHGKWQVGAGALPRWRRDGKELFFYAGGKCVAVDVNTDGPTFVSGIPKPLFEVHAVAPGGSYAVTGDGQRFLVPTVTEDKPPNEPIEVVVNWR